MSAYASSPDRNPPYDIQATHQANSFGQDHSAALTLVSVYKHERDSTTAGDQGKLGGETAEENPDMQRAIDLVELHYGVKMKHVQGEDAALRQARGEVDVVLEKLKDHSPKNKGVRE